MLTVRVLLSSTTRPNTGLDSYPRPAPNTDSPIFAFPLTTTESGPATFMTDNAPPPKTEPPTSEFTDTRKPFERTIAYAYWGLDAGSEDVAYPVGCLPFIHGMSTSPSGPMAMMDVYSGPLSTLPSAAYLIPRPPP